MYSVAVRRQLPTCYRVGSIPHCDKTILIAFCLFRFFLVLALSGSYIPRNASYAFEQISTKVLFGATEEVVKADTLPQCLGVCLESKELFDFVCRSTMYYYETRDCLLNSLDRKTARKALSDDTEEIKHS